MKDLENQYKWDIRFLELSHLVSTWSKDSSTKVGSVVTNGNKIISVGYNGFPRGIKDDDRLLDRETKYSIILHAEENSLYEAKQDLEGFTIYTTPFMPCSKCASKIIQFGIKRVVSYQSNSERWVNSFELSSDLFNEAGVELVLYPTPDTWL